MCFTFTAPSKASFVLTSPPRSCLAHLVEIQLKPAVVAASMAVPIPSLLDDSVQPSISFVSHFSCYFVRVKQSAELVARSGTF